MLKFIIFVFYSIVLVNTTNITQLEINNTSDVSEFSSINSTKNRDEPIAESQEIFRSVEVLYNHTNTNLTNSNSNNNNNNNNNNNKSNAISDFRPSPHLETYYEFNRSPVIPALPEAKHISNNFENYRGKPEEQLNVKWSITEQPWMAKVKFPTNEIKPMYPFYSGVDKSQEYPTKFDNGGDYLKPSLEKPQNNWNNYERRRPIKNQFDFTAPVDVSHHKTYEYNTGEMEYKNGYDPWKKIIKFLTTVLPISLLISALTPTVITVTPINGTQSRSRAEDSSLQHNTRKLITSLDNFNQMNRNCEDRVLCELLVSASTTKNAEQHVDNLLNRFIQDEKTADRIEEIKRIFDAVRNQDCHPIICKKIKENT